MARYSRKLFMIMAILTVGCLTVVDAPAAGAGLIGDVFTTGTLYDVNPQTGATSNPRTTGLTNLAGIAFSPSGELYGLTARLGEPSAQSLYQINPTTGAATLIGPTGLTNLFEGDLGFDRTTGILYGVQEIPATGGRELFTMNTSTGAATIIGSVEQFGDLSGLAFDKSGRLFILDDDNVNGISQLLEVNKSTAAIISSVDLSLKLGPILGMDFNPSTGVLYVADGSGPETSGTNSLYTLDTTTGKLALIGNTGLSTGLAGLAFSANSVPEPASIALLGLGIMAVVVVGRRSIYSNAAQ